MNKKIFTLVFSAFLDALGFSFILPIIPFIVGDFGGNSFVTGLAVSSAAIGMFVGGLLFGKLSDKYGRKKILIITIILNIIGYLIFGFSTSLVIFFIARLVSGLGGGGVSVTQAFLGDISEEHKRVENMGYMGAGLGLGFALGPIFGASLYSLNLTQIGFISAGILSISLLNVIIFLEEPQKIHHVEGDLKLKGTGKKLLTMFISLLIIGASFAGAQTVFALFLNENFAFNKTQIGYTFGFIGIIAIIYQGFLIKYVFRLIKEKGLILAGVFLLGLGFLLLGIRLNTVGLFIALFILAIGLTSANSTIYSLITHFSHKKDLGRNMGLSTAFTSIADIIGPLISGALFLYSSYLPFSFFGIILVINSFILYLLLKDKEGKNT